MTENNKCPNLELVEGTLLADCVAALVYTTLPSKAAALATGRALVEARLAG